VAFPVT